MTLKHGYFKVEVKLPFKCCIDHELYAEIHWQTSISTEVAFILLCIQAMSSKWCKTKYSKG